RSRFPGGSSPRPAGRHLRPPAGACRPELAGLSGAVPRRRLRDEAVRRRGGATAGGGGDSRGRPRPAPLPAPHRPPLGHGGGLAGSTDFRRHELARPAAPAGRSRPKGRRHDHRSAPPAERRGGADASGDRPRAGDRPRPGGGASGAGGGAGQDAGGGGGGGGETPTKLKRLPPQCRDAPCRGEPPVGASPKRKRRFKRKGSSWRHQGKSRGPVPADSLRGVRCYPRLGDALTGGSPRHRASLHWGGRGEAGEEGRSSFPYRKIPDFGGAAASPPPISLWLRSLMRSISLSIFSWASWRRRA